MIQKHAIPLDKVHAGKAIFAHEGAEYTGQFEEPVNHAIKVLIPGNTGSNYETRKSMFQGSSVLLPADTQLVNQSVDRVLHITRVTRFGNELESELAPAAISSAIVTEAPRQQPKGLRARYQPFGVTNGVTSTENARLDTPDSDEDAEMTQAPPLSTDSARNAKSDTPKKAVKKRKHGDVEKATPSREEVAPSPTKKPKKARVDGANTKPTESLAAEASQQSLTAESTEPARSSPVKKSKGKDKSKKEGSASTAKPSDSKKPAKVTPILPPTVPGVKRT